MKRPLTLSSLLWTDEAVLEVWDSRIQAPSHYVAGRQFQPIEVAEDWQLGFHLGNVLKYIARAGRKGSEKEDLQKAAWYLHRKLGLLQEERQVGTGEERA